VTIRVKLSAAGVDALAGGGRARVGHNAWKLTSEVVARSVAGSWDEAKAEWSLADVYFADEPGRCLCGHAPIVECCVLVNEANGNTVVVGNVCVKRFLGLSLGDVFAGLRRVARDPGRALTPAAVEHAHRRGWINAWERDFYLDTLRSKRLSARQRAKRREINELVLAAVAGAGR